jgi:nitroreductase
MRGYRKFAPTSIQSVSAAVTIMLLAFHTMGLGAVWMVAPLLAKEKIESILKPPPETDLVCMVAVGYPDEIRKSGRKPVEKVFEVIS